MAQIARTWTWNPCSMLLQDVGGEMYAFLLHSISSFSPIMLHPKTIIGYKTWASLWLVLPPDQTAPSLPPKPQSSTGRRSNADFSWKVESNIQHCSLQRTASSENIQCGLLSLQFFERDKSLFGEITKWHVWKQTKPSKKACGQMTTFELKWKTQTTHICDIHIIGSINK